MEGHWDWLDDSFTPVRDVWTNFKMWVQTIVFELFV